MRVQEAASPHARAKINWPLALGWIIVGVIGFIALYGKALAPRDPMQETFIAQNSAGLWLKPPFAAFAVPGYWLGSDAQGRDLLSQLLWAVRPTMMMVLLVAGVRLLAGTIIGLASGWSSSRAGRLLDTAISAGLAVPVLIVALAAIAVIGIESGVWAFILGLSLTGWAETARLVREQTRGIKGQPYVEAARALGQIDLQIIVRHVLRQIAPVLWMLFAFEISGSLLAVATLGFLGYFLGGGVWFQVEDFAMQRIAGTPELGQMLAIAAESRDRPEMMIFAGTIVFAAVMGFNLLGEGLRLRLGQARPARDLTLGERFGIWLEDNVWMPLLGWIGANARLLQIVLAAVLVLAIGGGLLWQRFQSLMPPTPPQAAVAVAGANLWASERRDPQGTLSIDAPGPSSPTILWKFESPTRLVGGPAIAADGTLYLAGEQTLYAVSSSGALLWQASLTGEATGTPALSASGDIYVAGAEGELSAFSSTGQLLWMLPPTGKAATLSGPIVGPEGIIYFPVEGLMQAVSPDGQLKWQAKLPYGYVSPLPKLDPSGERLIFEDLFFNARTGKALSEITFNPLDRYMVGADGKMYLQEETSVTEWRPEGEQAVPPVAWNLRGFASGFPTDSGVTNQQFVWLMFNTGFQDERIVWADLKGQVLGTVSIPHRSGRVIGVDGNSTLYTCGPGRAREVECLAYEIGEEEPRWQLSLDKGIGIPNGGALVPGRLYVTLDAGVLYAIGE